MESTGGVILALRILGVLRISRHQAGEGTFDVQ
jgi:hypothetical protein